MNENVWNIFHIIILHVYTALIMSAEISLYSPAVLI